MGDNFFLRRPTATEGDSSGKVGTLPQTSNRCMLGMPSTHFRDRVNYFANFIELQTYFLELSQTLAFCTSCDHEVLQDCKSKQNNFRLTTILWPVNTEEDGRKLKNIYIDLILKKKCSFSLYLKFGISKWKCHFILSFLI